ncbi:PAS domain S-box protein [Methanolobus sp. WCC4]|uniref:PAS domain-containing sensor histidine kinase n=1 Tax=Methanolobus sp. WCC4 TaxID=3125784 RepID=UPI0030FA16F3
MRSNAYGSLYSFVGKWKMNTEKTEGNAIGNLADIVEIILDNAPIEEVMEILIDRIPSIFPEPENVAAGIEWMDMKCEAFSCEKEELVLRSDIVIDGTKEGTIRIAVRNMDRKNIDDAHLIEEYKRLLGLIARMISVFFEKRKEVADLRNRAKIARDYCEKIDDYIFILDHDGTILDFNTNFMECTGYTAEQLRQMNITDIMSQCAEGFRESFPVTDTILNGHSTFELEHRCDTGETIPMSVKCKPLDDKNESFLCVATDRSEAKKAETELEESERKYSTIVEKSNDGILIVQNGKIVFANSRILEITGYVPEDLTDREYLMIIPEEDHKISKNWFREQRSDLNGNELFNMELVTKEDRIIPVEANWSIIDYEGQQADLLIIRDISERARTEELLQKERDRLENYLDVVGSIIGITNSDAEIIFVNKVGAEILGYTKEDIIGRNWFTDFLPESVREPTREAFHKVMAGEIDPPQYFENLLLTGEGEERLIFWHDVPLEDENGKRIGMISSGEDITESRKMEALLVESEKNLKTIFNNIDDQIFIHRPYGNFIDVNMAVLHSSGYTKEEMLELGPKDIVRPELQPLMDAYTERIMKDKKIIFEIPYIRKNGDLLPLEINSRLIEYKGEEAIISVARDVTERKKAEDRLKRYAGELKHSNELKDLFTDIIRHDLLTPASVVKGYTEELLLTIKDEETLKLAEKVRDNNDRLIELLETATKLAKLQKEEEITFEKLDLVPVIKMVIESFGTQLEMKEQEVKITTDGKYLSRVNPVIEEVFANLLSNAIKYSTNKSTIDITLEDEEKMWKVSVADHGPGIPDEEKPLLFNRFHRADKRGVKGTGLGLAIVKRIIEMHGGKYGVDDRPDGQGSVFWVTVRKA